MNQTVLVALLGVFSAFVGALGKASYDKRRNGNGNGHSVESVIAHRAELEFQTRMTVVMEQMTATLQEVAATIRAVHTELVNHRESSTTVAEHTVQIHGNVKEIIREIQRQAQLARPARAAGAGG